jgi:hypothetical protein
MADLSYYILHVCVRVCVRELACAVKTDSIPTFKASLHIPSNYCKSDNFPLFNYTAPIFLLITRSLNKENLIEFKTHSGRYQAL